MLVGSVIPLCKICIVVGSVKPHGTFLRFSTGVACGFYIACSSLFCVKFVPITTFI